MRVAFFTLLYGARAVAAQPAVDEVDRIAVATTDASFRSALERALAPADMTVQSVTQFDTPAIVDLANASRAIADREGATATVWLLFSTDGATLAAYDRDVDRVLVRELPFASPLDEGRAAEAARMARTMLRALRVTPDTDQLPPRAAEAPAIREQARAFVVAAPPPRPVEASSPRLGVELDGGMRVRGPGDGVAFSSALTLVWRPDTFGIALAARFAPAVDLPASAVAGSIADSSLALLARQPLRVSSRLAVAAGGGFALHRIRLDGNVSGMDVSDTALDPALRLGFTATTPLGDTFGIGIAMWADWLLRRQIYDAGATTLLTVPLVQLAGGLTVTGRFL